MICSLSCLGWRCLNWKTTTTCVGYRYLNYKIKYEWKISCRIQRNRDYIDQEISKSGRQGHIKFRSGCSHLLISGINHKSTLVCVTNYLSNIYYYFIDRWINQRNDRCGTVTDTTGSHHSSPGDAHSTWSGPRQMEGKGGYSVQPT